MLAAAEIGSGRDRVSSAPQGAFSFHGCGNLSFQRDDNLYREALPCGHRNGPCGGDSERRRRSLVRFESPVSMCAINVVFPSSKPDKFLRFQDVLMRKTVVHSQVPTLFTLLVHPVGRKRRGSVIVGGGHSKTTIDIISCAHRSRFCILLKQTTRVLSRHREEKWRLPRVTRQSMRLGRRKSSGSRGLRDRVQWAGLTWMRRRAIM